MKHNKIIALTLILLFVPCNLSLNPHEELSLAPQKTEYNWNYWAFEFGLGASYLHVDFPGNAPIAGPNGEVPLKIAPYKLPLPDFRLGIEKSWRISNKWTVAFDFACLTPALAFGYLLSDRTRFNLGFHCPITLNTFKQLTIQPVQYSNGTTIANTQSVQGVQSKNQFLYISPRIGLDHFTSPNTMLRISFSYDWHKFYDYRTNAVIGNLHWPQITIGIKRLF